MPLIPCLPSYYKICRPRWRISRGNIKPSCGPREELLRLVCSIVAWTSPYARWRGPRCMSRLRTTERLRACGGWVKALLGKVVVPPPPRCHRGSVSGRRREHGASPGSNGN